MSKRRKGRAISGILLLDKPKGLTSNKALQLVKTLFNAQKAGHTGSLDPIATGMLPVCFGEATKVSAYLLDADKSYIARCQLGVTTSSGDADGEILEEKPVAGIDAGRITKILQKFKGEISQVPPMHSAVKQQGVPLYKLAHQGIEVERKPRLVTVYELELLGFEGEQFEIRVRCSKGTYIRTLAEEIGKELGCGAHIVELRRTQVGGLDQNIYTLDQLEKLQDQGLESLDQTLLPIEMALSQFPQVQLSKEAEYYLLKGQAVFIPRMTEQGLLRLYAAAGEFLGIGSVTDDGRVAPKRLMNQVKIG